jgi:hypothetical protein
LGKLLDRWSTQVPPGDAGLAAFRRFYGDLWRINDTKLPVAALLERAQAAQSAFTDLKAVLLAQVDRPSHTTIVFRMSGGTWAASR